MTIDTTTTNYITITLPLKKLSETVSHCPIPSKTELSTEHGITLYGEPSIHYETDKIILIYKGLPIVDNSEPFATPIYTGR